MKTQFNHNTDTETPTNTANGQSHDDAVCFAPAVGADLPKYIASLLEDDAAFEVERHLAECDCCKKKYLLVLRVQREAALRRNNTPTSNGAGALSNESLEDLEVGKHRD